MQRDIVLRWLQQISALIARLLRGDPSLSVLMIRERLDDARAQLLGPLAQVVDKLDPESAAQLLSDPYRIYGYAQLLALESAVERASGRTTAAETAARRAVALGREAIARADPVPPEWLAWVDAAAQEVPRDPS